VFVSAQTNTEAPAYDWHKGEAAAMVLAGAADLATTPWRLDRGTGVEWNPLMEDDAVRYATKAAVTVGVVWLHRRWDRQGKRKSAKALALSVATVWGAAAIWNLTQGDR
jgi:hypothetical protein